MSSGKRATGNPRVERDPISGGTPIPEFGAVDADALRMIVRTWRERYQGGLAMRSPSEPLTVQAKQSDDPGARKLSDDVAAAIVAGEFDEILGIQPNDLAPGESFGPHRTPGLSV